MSHLGDFMRSPGPAPQRSTSRPAPRRVFGPVLDYTRDLDNFISNVSALPRGTGCRFLLCLLSPCGTRLIAKAWCRKIPTPKAGEVVVRFKERKG